MKKSIILLLLIILLCGCNYQETNNIVDLQQPNDERNPINDQIEKMTIEEKIGQMIIIRTPALSVDEKYIELYNKLKPGGIILYGGNISTFENTKKFIEDVKKLNSIPTIVSIDQEGGNIQKIQLINDKDILSLPSMYELGLTHNKDYAFKEGQILAQQLKTLGVNVTFAPVLDLYNPQNSVIGNRSFGDKETISSMAISLANGIESEGVIPTYKHFPGHGSTTSDSHKGLPIINKSYSKLLSEDLVPFKTAIKSGAKIIMVGHLAFPNITGDNTPASLSKKFITDILQDDLGYQGLIITDALDMGALVNNYSDSQITTMAINAGADLLLMPRDLDNIVDIIKNNISEERINISVKKILKFKYDYLNKYDLLDERYLNNENQQEIVNKIKMASN